MHIHHLALRVRDFEKSLHFYQTLTELKIHTQFSANGGIIAYLQNASGETQLELIGMPEGETVKASGITRARNRSQSQDTKFPQSAAALIVRCCLKTDF